MWSQIETGGYGCTLEPVSDQCPVGGLAGTRNRERQYPKVTHGLAINKSINSWLGYCCPATPPVVPSPLTNVGGTAANLTFVNGKTRTIDNDLRLAIEILGRTQIGTAVSQYLASLIFARLVHSSLQELSTDIRFPDLTRRERNVEAIMISCPVKSRFM